MDLKNLLGKLDLIEGTMKGAEKQKTGPKFTGQWKGKDKGTPGQKLVGETDESLLKDLSKGPTPKSKEQELAEQFEAFLQALEEENLGVNEKRPVRQGSRPGREYTTTDKPSKRYKKVQGVDEDWGTQELSSQELSDRTNAAFATHDEETADWGNPGFVKHFGKKSIQSALNRKYGILKTLKDKSLPLAQRMKFKELLRNVEREIEDLQVAESQGDPHKIVTNKLKDIERSKNPSTSTDDLKQREEQAKADYRKYVAKMKKKDPNYIPLYKMDEAGATATASATSTAQNQLTPAAKNAMAASTQLKAATGTTAPTTQFMKAIDAATQGSAIDAKSAQALEPMMNVVKMAASDPKLANQFKGIANQARNLAQQQKAQK